MGRGGPGQQRERRAARRQDVEGNTRLKTALVKVAHRLLVIAYNVIARREPYRELGQERDGGARPAGTLAEATGVADFQGSKVQ